MGDVDQRFHETWLGMVQPVVGLVVSIPVLVEAQCAERLVPDAQTRLRFICDTAPDGSASCPDLRRLFHQLLGYPPEAIAEDDIDRLTLFVPEGPQVLRPSFVLRDPTAPTTPLVLVWNLPLGLDLDEPETVTGAFHYPPAAKFDRLLRHANVPIGLLTNGREFRLVYAPPGEATGSITFRLPDMLTVGGRPILDAFVMLLSAHRLYGVAPERTLPRLLQDSRRWQARVSERLADQVLEATTLLLDGLQEAAVRDGRRELLELASSDGDYVHRGILTALLRIVFLLYAEDAGLLPIEDELYEHAFSVTGLHARLREDATAYPDSMAQRFGAWGHLLATFRAVFLGVSCGHLRLPPRRGTLFDPHRFRFLEGWESGGAPIADPESRAATRVPTISDGTVLAILDKLVMLDGQRLSYRTLDVEQIGSVYERMLGYTVTRLADHAVCVRGTRRWVTLSEIEEQPPTRRSRWLRDTAGVSSTVADRFLRAFAEARGIDDKREALAILAVKESGQPLVREPGALVLQPRVSLESSTSHYTPRSLCQPLVARALGPLVRALGDAPTAEQILSLKICDPAMGSGAFLVESCRFLAERLVEAWKRDPTTLPERARTEDPTSVARRIVAQRCLYGVDRNPDAVELAKLSLWLVTLARDLPFTFVDHALRHGDSVVGLGLDEIARFDWRSGQEDLFLRREVISALAEALPIRRELEALASADTPAEQARKERLLWDAEDAVERLRVVADLVLAAYFLADTTSEREALRKRYYDAALAWLRDEAPLPSDVAEARAKLRQTVPAFHWTLEFPEIFHDARVDPLAPPTAAGEERLDGRMDAFVGNMPFIGGRRIATVHGERYASWLCHAFDASGEVDYVTYFFLRANELLGSRGSIGLIATRSIAQGDTRRAGLARLLSDGLVIYDAQSKMPWPGDANVLVAPVVLAKGTVREHIGQPRLNGVTVPRINSRLRSYAERKDPAALEANRGFAFVGCFLRGEGFVLSREEAQAVLETAPHEAPVIRRYLVGEDLAKDPRQAASRYVIDFGTMDLEEARAYPNAMAIVEARVRPDRERLRSTGADASHRRFWWRFANTRNDLRAWLVAHDECLVLPRVAKHLLVARAKTDQVFSEQVVVFGLSDPASFGILQSRVHEVWVRLLSSTLGEGLRYSASDCFDTFPFPSPTPGTALPEVAAAAERLEDLRRAYMEEEGVGLTITYNRLFDATCTDPRIVTLRQAHEENDAAVLSAYAHHDPEGAWSEVVVPPYCCVGAEDELRRERFEDAVIDRLFALNARRATAERSAAPPVSSARSRKRTRAKASA